MYFWYTSRVVFVPGVATIISWSDFCLATRDHLNIGVHKQQSLIPFERDITFHTSSTVAINERVWGVRLQAKNSILCSILTHEKYKKC